MAKLRKPKKIKPAKISWTHVPKEHTSYGASGKYNVLAYQDIAGGYHAKVGINDWNSFHKGDTLKSVMDAASVDIGKRMVAAAARKKKAAGKKMTPEQLRKRKITRLRNQVIGNQAARALGFSPANPGAEHRLRRLEMGFDD